MGSEAADKDEIPTTPKLHLFSLPPLKSQEHSGNLTSPLHTSASVPFKWEEQPGKPLPCLALALPSTTHGFKSLDLQLPPRLLNDSKFTKTPSPTTVLEGPYYYSNSVGRSVLQSSSFRFLRKRQGSFDGSLNLGGSGCSSPERGLLGAMVRSSSSRRKDKGLFGSWKKKRGFKSTSEAHGGNFVYPSPSDEGIGSSDGGANAKVTRMKRKSSLLGLSKGKTHFWATMYGALKQVIPRRSTKEKKDALQSQPCSSSQ